MPIVTVSLSDEAYRVWAAMPKGRRSARGAYLSMRNYGTKARATGERVAPIVEPGDLRIMDDGREYVWKTDGGWTVIE